MRTHKAEATALALLGTLAIACGDGATPATGPDAPAPAFDFTNGPAELPNVIRLEEQGGVGVIFDAERDLLLFVGLPEDPTDAVDCGGTEPFATNSVQIIGLLQEVLMVLVKSEPNLHVYQASTFTDFCTSEPIAVGQGRLVVTDNDILVSGTRTNSFGANVTGQVALASGGTATVSAHARFVIHPDGTFTVASEQVLLTP